MPTPTPNHPAIVALGEPMLEFNQARADAPDAYLRGFGGDTSNMAIAASRLLGTAAGGVGYVTRVGDDAFGRMLLDLWRREEVDTRGVAVDADGALFGRGGAASHWLHYVGPLLRARDWEATAVPELRVHARRLAERLLALPTAR